MQEVQFLFTWSVCPDPDICEPEEAENTVVKQAGCMHCNRDLHGVFTAPVSMADTPQDYSLPGRVITLEEERPHVREQQGTSVQVHCSLLGMRNAQALCALPRPFSQATCEKPIITSSTISMM